MSEKEIKSDLIDYMNQDGAKEISSDNPYNDTDAVILSSMSYLNFEDPRLNMQGKTIGKYADAYMKNDLYTKLKNLNDSNGTVAQRMAKEYINNR